MESRDYHLTTCGGVGCLMSVGSYGVGMWLAVTGDTLAGCVMCSAASVFLAVAFMAFNAIGKKRKRKTKEYTIGNNFGEL